MRKKCFIELSETPLESGLFLIVAAFEVGEDVEQPNAVEVDRYMPDVLGFYYDKTTGTIVEPGSVGGPDAA